MVGRRCEDQRLCATGTRYPGFAAAAACTGGSVELDECLADRATVLGQVGFTDRSRYIPATFGVLHERVRPRRS
jgi:hypothetical protein